MDILLKPGTIPPSASSRKLISVLDLEGRADPETNPKLDLPLVRRIYESMLRTRAIDARLMKLQRQGRIGFHVGCEGEEAAIIASAAAMRDQDWLFPCYREVGAALYRGFSLQTYIDNMYGNANDVPKGRQMPDHITARQQHFGSITAPIGTQITQAVGFAWAAKIKKQDVVTASYFGDGATSSNDFHAGMNFAGVYQAPTLFLLRNNGWAISVPSEQQTHSRTYADKGLAYGVPGVRVDGNDALAVFAVTRAATERAASGGGPTLIELVTYRAGAHSSSDDPTAYREAAAHEEHLKSDPLRRLRRYLEREGGWSDAEQQAAEEKITAELSACIEKAEAAPAPSIASMFEDVFEHMPPHLVEQQAECVNGPRTRKRH
ncbi:MAG TPA: thiamine pyrophosphate-dependent enzyme [Polyangiales bacterium]|jgi:2-oxoisovalerate dehydrogenase E1 component alpha subunit|nr:thiamine pyrophosphate-dependent enzyme [Polyangiales bacterium]